MCTISINPASIVAIPLGGNSTGPTQISLSGTVANCTSNSVTVEVACPGIAPSQVNAVISGGTWTASLPSKCSCGTPVTITATCHDTPPCTATHNTTLICNCCPLISTRICVEYDSSGHAVVNFDCKVTVPAGCGPVTVQRDFGDGTPLGLPKTFTVGPNQPYSEIHTYNSGHTYTSTVSVLSRPSCPPSSTTLTINPPPPCSVIPFVTHLCAWAQFLFLLNGAAGAVLFFASPNGCLAANPALPGIAGAFSSAALIFLAILWFGCRKCVCRLPVKLLGQLLLVIGALLCMFIYQPSCLQLGLLNMIWITLIVLLVAFFVLHVVWYGMGCCPLKICDYWRAVAAAMVVAFVAAPLVFLSLSGGVPAPGLGLALLVAFLIQNFAGIQITISQGANQC